MMLARHSKPMETSRPEGVFRSLWHTTQRSEVWNSGLGALRSASPLINREDDEISTATAARKAQDVFLITSLRSAFRQPNPTRDRTTPEWGGPGYDWPALE